jgi:hypothetical protein
MRLELRSAITATFVLALSSSVVIAQEKNTFVGNLVLKDIDTADGVNFELVEPFGYIDSEGNRWQAEKGLVTDCASIPRALWSVVGAPCTGPYRRAAIIHDFYCVFKYRPWEKVHKVFYDAMIASGVPQLKAKLMYYAVWRFGPRWEIEPIFICNGACTLITEILSNVVVIDNDSRERYKAELRDIEARINDRDLSLTEIQNLADESDPVPRIQRRYHR